VFGALSMVVDRQSMLQNVFGAQGRLAHGPSMTAPYADSSLHPPPFDNSGQGDARFVWLACRCEWYQGEKRPPTAFGIVTGPSLYRRRYVVLLQDQFRRIGAQECRAARQHGNVAALQTGNYDAILWGFSDPSPAASRLGDIGHREERTELSSTERKVDALLDSVSAAADAAKSKAYVPKAFRLSSMTRPPSGLRLFTPTR
jgi:hypothetical protein